MANPLLGKKFWLKHGSQFVAAARKHLFIQGYDVHNERYPPYCDAYKTAKATGKLKRQATQYKDKNVPILTGDLLRDFKLHKIKSDGFQTGFVAWGSKVESLAKKGRELTTKEQPLPQFIIDIIEKRMNTHIEAQNKKDFNKKTKIDIKTGK